MFSYRYKYPIALVVYTAGVLGYWVTNQFQVFEPTTMPLTWVDQAVPFWPASVLVYLAIIPVILPVPFIIDNENMFKRAMLATVLMSTFSFLIYVFVPTHYPIRQDLLEQIQSPFWRWGYETMYAFDSSANCFPSFHVSVATTLTFIYFKEKMKLFRWHVVICSVIIFTTLTTKQHYFWDIVGGVLVALMAYVIAYEQYPVKKKNLDKDKNCS
ncbi:phosphatase PAP2 family protein [Candidatus Falkowbacteria bacterium]|jgi:membrane-associated phospholipid phosphatase|nr:phosphatase PAP2 family protein [Candidatus Falkowbacteria bacterium]MBT5503079.1 phosphatase PAP2 family protein [Candidatus Falkowbacteria bacterium]MBT6574173.1 phosphatase PAP2 family protein [Candidatus Falkowbacteria bacterium]MBT7348680.1 phosphatase PAP2 family protein [Candidatus Falkowbacteria bacterium]MBT7500470.1 phosphatase PAP2 family protein [Candidatus Falkowbacteria bacterium]